jgi:resuscitation-promoting factor RpfB
VTAPAPPPAPPAARPRTAAAPSAAGPITAKVTGYALGAGAVTTRTASGTTAHWGTVAADTRLYPFGTRLRIEGLDDTIFVVEDTGSAVRGNVFDVWFPDAASARRLGARTRQVSIASPDEP